MSLTLKPIAAAKTDKGICRNWNEDTVFASISPSNDRALLIVADGMGGFRDGKLLGKLASQLTVDTLYHELRDLIEQIKNEPEPHQEPSEDYLIERLHLAFQKANSVLDQHQPPDEKRFSSAITCAFVQSHQAIVANIGDCKTYLYRNNQLRLITTNRPFGGDGTPSSVGSGMFYDVVLTYGAPFGVGSEIRVIKWDQSDEMMPDRNLMRFVQLNLWTLSLEPGDRLLLCSDGLWGELLDNNKIKESLSKFATPERAAQQLMETANAEGGHDNIGVVVCDFVSG